MFTMSITQQKSTSCTDVIRGVRSFNETRGVGM